MDKTVEIVKINEKEFLIGKNIIRVEESFIYIEAIGEQTKEIAEITKKYYKKIYTLLPRKMNQLINLNASGKNSPEARKLWKEINEHELTGKVAVFGMHPVARVLASFVMSITHKKSVRFFTTKEEAVAWLERD